VGRFLLAIAASAVLILAAPIVGQLRATLQDVFPGQYRFIIATAVFGSVALAMAVAIARINDRRLARYGTIVLALVLGGSYAAIFRTGDAAVDAVERFHFVEYGIIAFLFYRAWRYVGDASLLILPLLAGFLVGTCEEWLQWYVPSRVGELRDVLLNMWAVMCGLMFSAALDPPDRLELSLRHESWTRIKRVAAATILVLGLFLTSVHIGYVIDDASTGAFRSTYTGERLDRLSADRARRWRTEPPLTWSRFSREDQYLSEGVTHVRARNRCWDEQNVSCAWHENLILERYFTPVLDTPSYISPTGHRWAPEQRADAAVRAAADTRPFISDADETPIFPWPKTVFWSALGMVIAALLLPLR